MSPTSKNESNDDESDSLKSYLDSDFIDEE